MKYHTKRKLAVLQRRHDHLDTRLGTRVGDKGASFDRAERAALKWALDIIHDVDAMNMLDVLTATRGCDLSDESTPFEKPRAA